MHPDNTNNDLSFEKPWNANYEADMKHQIRYIRWLFQLLGIWPIVSEDASKVAKHVSKILIPFCLIVSTFIFVPEFHYVFMKERNIVAKIERLPPILFFSANFLKYAFMVYRYDAIKHCLEYVKTDWMRIESEKDRAIMMTNVRFGHRLTLIYIGILYFCGVSFHVTPLWASNSLNEFNETVRVFAYSSYDMFVDSHKSPNYEILFFTIFISAMVGYTVSITVCSVSAILVSHACAQIDIVISRIESFLEESSENVNNNKLRNRISFVVQRHLTILRFSETIEMALQEICLIEVVASAVVICSLEYVIAMEWNNSDFMFLLTFIVAVFAISFNIFILCYVGELLTEKSAQIGESTYMIDWYKLSGRGGLSLVMIMNISKYPLKLTAGKIMHLSIFNFGNIIQRSFAYLNMLRTITVK